MLNAGLTLLMSREWEMSFYCIPICPNYLAFIRFFIIMRILNNDNVRPYNEFAMAKLYGRVEIGGLERILYGADFRCRINCCVLFHNFLFFDVQHRPGAGLEPAQCRQSSGMDPGSVPVLEDGLHMLVYMLQELISAGAVICHIEGLAVLGAVSFTNIPGYGLQG